MSPQRKPLPRVRRSSGSSRIWRTRWAWRPPIRFTCTADSFVYLIERADARRTRCVPASLTAGGGTRCSCSPEKPFECRSHSHIIEACTSTTVIFSNRRHGDDAELPRDVASRGAGDDETLRQSMEHSPYGLRVTLPVPFDAAVADATAALKAEGFGLLTTIDVQHTLK